MPQPQVRAQTAPPPRPRFSARTTAEPYRAEMLLLEGPKVARQARLTFQDLPGCDAAEAEHRGYTPHTVALLSTDDIVRMDADEMLEVIRVADFPILSFDDLRRLKFAHRSTLERLVYLARECCRNRECRDGHAHRRIGSGDTFKWFRSKPR
ncbi:MAG: hypothetical protein R3C19_12520 [Planctomycetaceae bacterium]